MSQDFWDILTELTFAKMLNAQNAVEGKSKCIIGLLNIQIVMYLYSCTLGAHVSCVFDEVAEFEDF